MRARDRLLRTTLLALALGALLSCSWTHGRKNTSSRDIPCMSAGECPWSGNPCVIPMCENERCQSTPAPEGIIPEGQVGGDCRETYCDGKGRLLERAKEDDPPLDDTDPCTEPVCKGTKVAHDPTEVGTPCGVEGLCNGKGGCGICMPGVKRCNGNAVDACDDEGQWAGAIECPSATPICTGATCIGIAEIAAGDEHACARLTDGTVRCWGDDSLGQLGDRGSPRSPPLGGVAEVSFGGAHACARLQDATVVCWGDNARGQLGDGTGEDRSSPTPVPKLAGVAQLATGAGHTCARLADGTAKCWGDDARGQLGDGATPPKPKNPPPPFSGTGRAGGPAREVSALAGIASLTVGFSRSCASKSGSLLCWGEPRPSPIPTSGGPGGAPLAHPHASAPTHAPPPKHAPPPSHGKAPARSAPPPKPSKPPPAKKADGKASPILVKGLKDAVDLRAGAAHSCARLTDGTVACWGSNEFGQLGDGSKTDRPAPVKVKDLAGVVELAIGTDHTCARLQDASLRCWGHNDAGQLGDGSHDDRETPTPVAGVTGVAQLSVGGTHACVRQTNGAVVCWGDGAGPAKIVW